MTLLSKVSNEAVNDNLHKRFQNAEIYTYIGNVLISVNPFRDLGIYGQDTLSSYRGKNRLEMSPHVFAIAESAYYNMQAYKENQCVIITGESGAGKTEAAKRIMQYIAAVSAEGARDIQDIKEMVLATNPLLESFGCAKTLRNNNSSRHGKFLEIMHDEQGAPTGASIRNFLLEKSRVVGQIRDERNFHIFYQLTKGANDSQREYFGIQGPEAYAYTSKSKCLDVQGINDVADFNSTLDAMNTIGLTGEEQNDIIRMLASILWLGNAVFRENAQGNAEISDPGVPDFVAYLLEVDSAAVTKALTEKIVETQRGVGRRGSVYESPLNPAQAGAVRDALAKAIYNNLFDWLVARINTSMAPRGAVSNMIGILDIYGFEIFEQNSFEQLCINFVNEKLQQIFIALVLRKEQEEYDAEQIQWKPIPYFDNAIVCELIEGVRPKPGIFATLNDAGATAHADPAAADNAFMQRASALTSNPRFEARGARFTIRHYAGDVSYTIGGLAEKNRDALAKDILDLVDTSSNGFLRSLFSERPDPNSKKRPPTAGDRIKASATDLVDTLMKAEPHYIRTIKPNETKSPKDYDTARVLEQAVYLALAENIRVRRAGFAYRSTFERLVERFYLLSPATSYAGEYTWQGDARSGCERILTDTGIANEEWQMGVTKAFIKSPETLFALEKMRTEYWNNKARMIQRAFRNYMRYKNECARRIQRVWRTQASRLALVQLRDYGHQMLASRKERRRFSLISMRRFTGDYLDIGGSSAEGEMLKRASGMASTEDVAFSARVHILVSRLGRSSKPSPRFFVLTDKAAYFLVTQLVNKQPQTTCERRIVLGSIQSVGLSALRDDWIVFNVSGTPEPDPVFHTHFKTELTTHLLQRTSGAVNVIVSNALEHSTGKDKKKIVKFQKDEAVQREDVYKSSTVTVASGEAPSSLSKPPAKKKPGLVRPITSGKLLRAGGPSNANRVAKPRAVPRPTPTPATLPSGRKAAAPAAPAGIPTTNGSSNRAAAPKRASVAAPPPPPAVPKYLVLYAFDTDQDGEMSLAKDEEVEVTQKEENGWWLVKKNGIEGWAPSNYLELIKQAPKPKVAPPPAPPSTKRAPPPAPAASGGDDAGAAPVAVMPGMGAPGGFAAVLAKKKAEAAAARGKPPAPPKPSAAGSGGARLPPPPPRRP
ncbi:myosin class i heavy chain [Ceraceosorus bombacis]|uniref:Myosin class i heavy chain n=1 Tax=Ceraceosorus bombacis TaxID=401625 RepID=A0A0P1BLF5_9BASI|nr:myosin class i heavy chain [Ceraceosorus bombacis]